LNETSLKNFISKSLSRPLEYLSLHGVCKSNKLLETFASKPEPFISGLKTFEIYDTVLIEFMSKFLEKTPLLKSFGIKQMANG
jgi:hypothetical protein